MTTKDQLLALLEEHKGQFVSGEETAASLSLSRTAIWKGIESLRAEGYTIEAVRRKGYRLPEESDLISEAGVRKYLPGDLSPVDLIVKQTVTSTNDVLKEMAAAGAPERTIVLAAKQTAGKGRVGRSFFSPDDSGVYLSILMRPAGFSVQRAQRLTTIAAVAACDAIDELMAGADGSCADAAQIKWVNDVYVRGRKVVGILTEAGLDLESGELEYAVLGIGFNVYDPKDGFPEEIRDRAGAILGERVGDGKNRLAAAFIRCFLSSYAQETGRADVGEVREGAAVHAPVPAYIRSYQERCFVVGRAIDVIAGGKSRPAKALSVDDDCHLLVEYEDGTRETLFSGEVSIRV